MAKNLYQPPQHGVIFALVDEWSNPDELPDTLTIQVWHPEYGIDGQRHFNKFIRWFLTLPGKVLNARGFSNSEIKAYRRNPLHFLSTLRDNHFEQLKDKKHDSPEKFLFWYADFAAWLFEQTEFTLYHMGFNKKQIRRHAQNPLSFYLHLTRAGREKLHYSWFHH